MRLARSPNFDKNQIEKNCGPAAVRVYGEPF